MTQKEVLKEVLKEGSSSPSDEIPTLVEENKPERPTTTTASPLNQDEKLWRELEFQAQCAIDLSARIQIMKSLERQQFDLERFVAYFRRYEISKRAHNPVGILISKAERFEREAAAFDREEKPISKEDAFFGARLYKDLTEEAASYKCLACKDSGRTDTINPLALEWGAPCLICEAGTQARFRDEESLALRKEQKREKAEHAAKMDQYRRDGVCPSCEGTGAVKLPGPYLGKKCLGCKGTGQWVQADSSDSEP